MDVAPPWYTVSGETCSGETRRCGGGDAACQAQAERDGYVPISIYSFCKRDEVRTVPTLNAVVMLALCLAVLAAAVLALTRRARRTRPPR
jgi:hypothetical protein